MTFEQQKMIEYWAFLNKLEEGLDIEISSGSLENPIVLQENVEFLMKANFLSEK